MSDTPSSKPDRTRPKLGKGLGEILSRPGVPEGTVETLFGEDTANARALDTGWIDVGSTRVKQIRWIPMSELGSGVGDSYMGNLYVRFVKYETAYVYRNVPRPTMDVVYGYGMAGAGIGGYINSVLNSFPRDYCTDKELTDYFGGWGGSYRGPR